MVPLPTEAALRARRLEAMREAVKARITAGQLDDVKTFVASLAHDTRPDGRGGRRHRHAL